MRVGKIEQQRHGYVGGHQLLARSLNLSRVDQDVVDRLSDIGGQPGPDEAVPPYLTGYPLPSGEFFALARTWYDYSAPRSGCVLTHTLLIPVATWANALSLLPFTALHHPFDREASAKSLPSLSLIQGPREPYPIIDSDGLSELCEAVFLEERRPIVWLTEPNDVVALRVIEALWPALRSRFAFQSYALKPRSQAHGPFDLMLAPRTARGRFSSWEGRRIDSDSPARHPFTPLLIEAVFGTPFPSLEAADPLGLLADDDVGDPAKLRLSILWNNLSVSAAHDPDAALGMLDILSAANLGKEHRWKLAEPIFQSVFAEAAKRESRAASTINVALGKLEAGDGERLSKSIAKSAAKLTQNDPEGAMRLSGNRWRDSTATPIFRQAVAEAMVKVPHDRGWDALSSASPELAAELLQRDHRLLPHLLQGGETGLPQWRWLAEVIGELDRAELDQARAVALPSIRTAAQVPVLRQLLAGANLQELARALEHLDKGNGLQEDTIVQAVVELKSLPRIDKLQAIVIAKISPMQLKRLLSPLLRPTAEDTAWLLTADIRAAERSSLLIQQLLNSTRSERQSMQVHEPSRLDQILELVVGGDEGDRLAAKLIAEAGRLADSTFARTLMHFGTGRSPYSVEVIANLIDQVAPPHSSSETHRLAMLLRTAIAPQSVRSLAPILLEILIPDQTRDAELTYSLGILIATQLEGELRREFIDNLALLSARASRVRIYKLSDEAYEAWALLIREAIEGGGDNAAVAAQSAVAYAIRRDFYATLPLVRVSFVAAFNSIYGPSKRNRRDAEELGKGIAKLFARNSWPAHLLLELLEQTRDPEFAIKAAASSWDGEKVIKKALGA